MAAVFPGSVKIFTGKTDLVDTVLAEHVNTLQDEVSATQSTLGTGLLSSTWAGVYSTPSTHTSLTTRLANIESGLVSLGNSKQDSATAVTLTGTQTLTNKTLTTPVIASISNSGTITIPTGTDTLVGRATTDTLTNKTLTSPTINGATISGTFTSTATISGGTVNATTLQQGGVQAVTTTGTQTLTNKTLTSPVISTIVNTGTLTLPTSTDTLVGRATTDTLTNKTLTLPTIGGTGATFSGATSGTTVLKASATAGTTTLTMPAITDTLVTLTATQTLTNKTIDGASNTFTNIPQSAISGLTSGYVTLAGIETLTNKTLTSPTINGATISGTFTSTATITGGTMNPTTLQQNSVAVVTVSGTQTLTNKTLTSPVISTISNTGTLTLPTSTDTLVGRATTDTLTNKTMTRANDNWPLIKAPREPLNIVAAGAASTISIDLDTAAIWYYTSSATANFTLNFRHSSGSTLNSVMNTGETVSVVFMATNGATPYYATAFQIDTAAVTPKWMYGSAPAAGNANSIDVYEFTIVKTGAATFTVFASAAKFA